MKNLYAIGEMSKLHNVPIRTLRYYDQIGLFKPIVVDETSGYRYYSTEQFEQLNTINYLKFLGLSLKEIQRHLESRDIQYFLTLLKKQQEITEAAIIKLRLISTQFSHRIKEIEEALNIDILEKPIVKFLPERVIVSIDEQINSEPEWEIALRRLQKLNGNPSLFIGKVGFTVSEGNLMKKKFDEYNSVFILREEPVAETEQVKYLRAGDYGCIYFRGNHSTSPEYYEMLQQFIDSQGYEFDGDSIERIMIDEYITNDKNLHLTEIQIPLRFKY